MKSSTAYKFIFALMLLALGVYGLFYVYGEIELKRSNVQVYRLKEMQNKNFEFGNSLRENMRTLTEQEARIKSAFIPSAGMVDFIRTLEDAAQQNGLKIIINSVEQGEPQVLGDGPDKTSPVTFNIQVEGTYAQTMLFMNQLARFERKLSLSSVSIYKVAQGLYATKAAMAGIILSYE
jgi:Tfp pilus assembly protein PilO